MAILPLPYRLYNQRQMPFCFTWKANSGDRHLVVTGTIEAPHTAWLTLHCPELSIQTLVDRARNLEYYRYSYAWRDYRLGQAAAL